MPDYYLPQRYWDDRFAAKYDESAVGYTGLARSVNRARYSVERRNVARALNAAGIPTPNRVLDVGSGTGIWIDFWRRRGAKSIVGVDLSATAVERLERRFPYRFVQCDVGDEDPPLPTDMDVVSAMSVLLHITDDGRFERAVRNLGRCLRVGGSLCLVEPIVVQRWWGHDFGAAANSKARSLATWTTILERAGLRIIDLRPSSILLTNVVDTRRRATFRLLASYWEALNLVVGPRERLGSVVGSALRVIDSVATTLVPLGPCAKILIARRV